MKVPRSTSSPSLHPALRSPCPATRYTLYLLLEEGARSLLVLLFVTEELPRKLVTFPTVRHPVVNVWKRSWIGIARDHLHGCRPRPGHDLLRQLLPHDPSIAGVNPVG